MSASPTDKVRPAGSEVTLRRPVLPRLRWLPDVLLALVLYHVYALLRNAQGVGQLQTGPTARAQRHGYEVLRLERALHLNIEHSAQAAVLALPSWLVRSANAYYATMHLLLTALVLAWLMLTGPRARFLVWRNTLVIATSLALLGFALLPTMPPRLLPAAAGYVDTVAVYGGLWSSQTPVLEHVAHPYAAMPSLHLVWALWAGTALWRHARPRWLRTLGLGHVLVTAVVVLVTGNHWLLDLVVGCAVFAVAAALARLGTHPLGTHPLGTHPLGTHPLGNTRPGSPRPHDRRVTRQLLRLRP